MHTFPVDDSSEEELRGCYHIMKIAQKIIENLLHNGQKGMVKKMKLTGGEITEKFLYMKAVLITLQKTENMFIVQEPVHRCLIKIVITQTEFHRQHSSATTKRPSTIPNNQEAIHHTMKIS